MNKEELQKFESRLLEDKKRLEEELGKLARKDGEEYDTKFQNLGDDEDDNAEEVEAYTVNLATTEALEKKLQETNDALEKIENGTYGKCENCQGDIRKERLEVYPAARNCMKCENS